MVDIDNKIKIVVLTFALTRAVTGKSLHYSREYQCESKILYELLPTMEAASSALATTSFNFNGFAA
ncbi:MAG: hypothetical protein ACLRU1_03950 [Veillonella parvula]